MSEIREWTIPGKVYKKDGPATDEPIIFQEELQTNNSTPVNAPLAVSLMTQLIGLIPPEILYPKKFKPISKQLDDWYRRLVQMRKNEKPDELESAEEEFQDILNKIKKLENVTVRLLRNSLAVTADKGTLLKALSQPGCEGLRFYQCVSGNTTVNPDMLSFVFLAVDKDRNDLSHKFNSSIKKDIERIPTTSFSAEYNKTSGPIDFYHLDETNPDLQPYVLLKYALNASDRPDPSKAQLP
jgi:hypothetical protein